MYFVHSDLSTFCYLAVEGSIISVNGEDVEVRDGIENIYPLPQLENPPEEGEEYREDVYVDINKVIRRVAINIRQPVPQGLAKTLHRVAFLAMLDLMSDEKGVDIEAGILSFIETQMPISTPQEKASRALAKRLFTEGQEFVGTNPLFAVLVPALGLSQSEFEAAWETAASFSW